MKISSRISIVLSFLIVVPSLALLPSASAWSGPSSTVTIFGGSLGDESRRVAVDREGNLFTAGYFSGTVDFDPGPEIVNLSALGRDAFISKLDSSGNFQWAKSFGGTGNENADVITFDGSGNIYVGGNFSTTVDFDPGDGTANLTSAKSEDAFILKLNSSGNFLWAKSFGGSDVDALYDGVSSIVVDSNQNVFATGYFTGTVDFDPGIDTATRTAIGDNQSDVFVLKLDPEGGFAWVDSFGSDSKDAGLSIALDSQGNIYAAGSFSGTVDFNPNREITEILRAENGEDAFVLKLSSSGSYIWVKTFGVSTSGGYDAARAITVDARGDIFAAGVFTGRVDFDPSNAGENLLGVANNLQSVFILKIDSSGRHVWARNLGGNDGSGQGHGIAIDANGNVYTAGLFVGTVDFDPGTAEAPLTATGPDDAFISKLDASGNHQWARRIGGLLSDRGRSVAVDGIGNVYITGQFRGQVDFDPASREAFFTSASANAYDVFVLKLNTTGEVDVAEAEAAHARAVSAAQVAAAQAAAFAAKAASVAAMAKQEAEKQSARADVTTAIKDAKELTVDTFAKAQIPGVTASNIADVQAELLALPVEARSDINQVLKVARKYEVVGMIASEKVNSVQPSMLVEVGLIPESSKNKVALAAAIRKLPADARDSLTEIKVAIEAAKAVIQNRSDRLAKILAKQSARSGK